MGREKALKAGNPLAVGVSNMELSGQVGRAVPCWRIRYKKQGLNGLGRALFRPSNLELIFADSGCGKPFFVASLLDESV